MSDGGKTQQHPGTSTPIQAELGQQPALPAIHRSVDPSKSIGPARFDGVRAERQAAAAQIDRSMKAWRAASGSAAGQAGAPKGSGAPLPSTVRSRMEPKLGANLGSVRVHTGGESAEAAKSFGARAFTVGDDVHFNAGEFQPGSKEGDKLLAHELTHVVQGQKSGVQRKADGDEKKGGDGDDAKASGDEKGGAEVSDPNEPAEKEADATGDKVGEELHGGDEKKDAKGGDKAKDGKKGKAGDEKGGSAPGEKSADGGDAGGDEKEGEGKKGDDTKEKAAPISAKLESRIGAKIFRDAKPAAAGAASGPPPVDVPFDMAGESHTLTVEPKNGDVEVSMASEKMPFDQKLPKVVEALDLFQAYVSTITDPDVKKEFDEKYLPKLNKVRTQSKSTYAAAYKAIFPGGGQSSTTTPQREQPKVKAAYTALEQQLASLKAWATDNGISDLSKPQMDKATEDIAKKAWDAGFAIVRGKIATAVAKYNYKGAAVRFVGSAATGRTGVHKGKVRFDATDFDVDMNVPNKADFAAGMAKSPAVGGKIFPNMAGYPGALKPINTAAVADLVATFPTVDKIGSSSIALMET